MAEKRKAPQGRNPNLVGEPLNWHGNMSFFNRTEGKICKEKHFINNIKN